MSAKRETRAMLDKLARHPGWSVSVGRRSNHYRIAGPGVLIFTGTTPSDGRVVRNLRAQLRRAGAPVP